MAIKNLGILRSRGLVNLNNTCWLNSILQCLAQTPNFLLRLQHQYSYQGLGGELILNGQSVTVPSLCFKYENSGELTSSLIDVLRQLGNGEIGKSVKPTLFLQAVIKRFKQFKRGQQEDAQEFLMCLIDALIMESKASFSKALSSSIKLNIGEDLLADPKNEEILKGFYMENVKVMPPMDRMFRGSLLKRSECQVCNNVVITKEVFYDLKLPISKLEGNCSLDTCLGKHLLPELLTNDEKVKCEKCTEMCGETMRTDTVVCSKIHFAPKVLTITLKRYDSISQKNNTFVDFPQFLNLTDYCTHKCISLSSKKEIAYALYAVEVHSGRMGGGHYTSYRRLRNQGDTPVKNKVLPGEFIYTSDEYIKSVPESEVMKTYPYILFYERLTSC